MAIKTNIYIKIIKTSFEEMENSKNYKVRCTYNIYRDETKGNLLCTLESELNDLKLEELSLTFVYSKIMEWFLKPEFI